MTQPQNIYNARNTTPGKPFPQPKPPAAKANSIAQQWQPPALQNAVLRLSAMARPPNTGINIDTLRQQLQQRFQTILKMHNDRLQGIYTPGSPFKSPKPMPAPAPVDPANGRGTYYPKPTTGNEAAASDPSGFRYKNTGVVGPSPVPVPKILPPGVPPTPFGF